MSHLKILLIRHAQSIGNVQKRMEGQSSTALSVLGNQQAQQLSQALVSQVLAATDQTLQTDQTLKKAQWPTHLYSSPLLRAHETAQRLADALKQAQQPLTCQPSAYLQEIHQGIFQGLTWTEATEQFPDLCAQLMGSLAWQPVPEAETLVEARNRAKRWLNNIEQRHQAGEVLWVVSHAGIMQYLIAAILGCDRTWHIPIKNTAIFEFWRSTAPIATPIDRHNPQRWLLKRFNDHSHL